jgi:acylphosphatase
VWYRASTQRQAQDFGVTGHAKNLADGRVEVLACGPEPAVEALCRWLWQGPTHAEVSAVECESLEADPPSGFVTG